MKRTFYWFNFSSILCLTVFLSLLYIASLELPASAAELTDYSKNFEVPQEKKATWENLLKALEYNYGVCLEHCGNDPKCLGKCQKAYKNQIDNSYQQLTQAQTSKLDPVRPSKDDKCPVCGMFVAKYPDWVGEIKFDDGTVAFFDGAKDLFKYYFNLKKYAPAKSEKDIAAIYVTEYYNMELIDAHSAFYVVGSDVYGPMGKELIPFNNKEDAEQFMKDHRGEKILQFQDVTLSVIGTLD